MVIALPVAMALIYEYYILTNAEHRVHIVGIDDGGYAIFMGYVAETKFGAETKGWTTTEELELSLIHI